MRVALVTSAILVACLPGCAKRSSSPSAQGVDEDASSRREGLWAQTVTRDGHRAVMGRFRLCVDPATDERLTLIGAAAGKARCDRRSTKGADGGMSFTSRCRLGHGGLIDTKGEVWSDYRSSYRLHAESVVSGSPLDALNGQHVTDVSARYLGPCPADMAPGDMIVGPGLKVNLGTLPMAAMGD
jgi:hypothetical protein